MSLPCAAALLLLDMSWSGCVSHRSQQRTSAPERCCTDQRPSLRSADTPTHRETDLRLLPVVDGKAFQEQASKTRIVPRKRCATLAELRNCLSRRIHTLVQSEQEWRRVPQHLPCNVVSSPQLICQKIGPRASRTRLPTPRDTSAAENLISASGSTGFTGACASLRLLRLLLQLLQLLPLRVGAECFHYSVCFAFLTVSCPISPPLPLRLDSGSLQPRRRREPVRLLSWLLARFCAILQRCACSIRRSSGSTMLLFQHVMCLFDTSLSLYV